MGSYSCVWPQNKVSWQMTPSHRLIGLYVNERTYESVTASELRAYESREDKFNLHPVTKIEWEGIWGNSLIATVNFGHNSHDNNVNVLTDGIVGREDLETERVTGENVVSGELAFRRSYVSRGSLTYYKPNWFMGNHEFKAGFDYADGLDYRALTPKAVNYHLLYNDGVPFQVAFFNAPVYPKWESTLSGDGNLFHGTVHQPDPEQPATP